MLEGDLAELGLGQWFRYMVHWHSLARGTEWTRLHLKGLQSVANTSLKIRLPRFELLFSKTNLPYIQPWKITHTLTLNFWIENRDSRTYFIELIWGLNMWIYINGIVSIKKMFHSLLVPKMDYIIQATWTKFLLI